MDVAIARLRLSRKASDVLRQIGLSLLGLDERYRVVGVPVAERVIAKAVKRAPSGVHAGVAELIAKGVLVRRVDGVRRNAWRYQIAHPTRWVYADEGGAPPGIETLPPDYVEGWGRTLLRFPAQTRGWCQDEVVPEVVHKAESGAHHGVSTHARASSGVEDDPLKEISLVDRYWVPIRGKRASLVEVVGATLNEWYPGWDNIGIERVQDVPSGVAVRLSEALPSDRGGWAPLIVRQAVVRAAELATLLEGDRRERERRAVEREAADARRRASDLLVRWHGMPASDASEYHEAARAIARIEAGELAELEVAEALVEIAEEAQLLAQAALVAPDAARSAFAPLASPAAIAEPATTAHAPAALTTVCAPPDLPERWRRRVPPPSPVPPDVPPDQVAERAAVVLAALEAALAAGTLDSTTRLLARTSLDHLRARLADRAPPRTLALVLRQAESVLARLTAPSLPLGEALPGVGDGAVEAGLQGLPRREYGEVLRHVDPALVELQQLDLRPFLPSAEDDPERGRLAGLELVASEPPEVELHLALVLGAEVTELQVESDEPAELPVVEEQVDVEVLVVDLHPLLPGDEREAGPELQQELLDIAEDGVLEIALQVAVLQPQEVEEVWVLQEERRRHHLLLAQPGEVVPDGLLGLPGDRAPLGQHRAHPLLELPGGPALEAAQLGVEVPLEGVVDVCEGPDMGPAQVDTQRVENPFVRESLRDAETMSELLDTPASPGVRVEPPRERVNDLVAVRRALATEHLRVEPTPDLQVHEGELRVHAGRHPSASSVDQGLHVGEERVGGESRWLHRDPVEHSFAAAHREPWPPRCRSDPPRCLA